MSKGVRYTFNQWFDDGIEDHGVFSKKHFFKLYFEDEELEKIRECQEEAFEKVREIYGRYLRRKFQKDFDYSPDSDKLLNLEIEKVQKSLDNYQDHYINFLKGQKGFESISGAEYHEIKHWVKKFEETVKEDDAERLTTLEAYGEGLKNVLQNNKLWIQKNPNIQGERIHNTLFYVAWNYDYLQWLKKVQENFKEPEYGINKIGDYIDRTKLDQFEKIEEKLCEIGFLNKHFTVKEDGKVTVRCEWLNGNRKKYDLIDLWFLLSHNSFFNQTTKDFQQRQFIGQRYLENHAALRESYKKYKSSEGEASKKFSLIESYFK